MDILTDLMVKLSMVDSTNSITSVQNVLSGNRARSSGNNKETAGDVRSSAPAHDEVKISDEALSLQQIEQAITETKAQIEQSKLPLGLSQDFISESLA